MANLFDDVLPDRPNLFDDVLPSGSSSAMGAFGRGALESALPTAAGLGASAAVLGAVPTGGLSLLAIPAGLVAGYGASRLQDVATKAINPRGREAFLQQRGEDIVQHPVASTLGEVVPSLAALRPGFPRTLPLAKTAAISGAMQGGIEAGVEAVQGQPLNPARIATQAAVGATLNKPTRLGQRMGFPAPKVAPRQMIAEDLTPEQTARVERVTDAVKAAKPIRQSQEALMSAERSKRLGRVMGIRGQVGGEAGLRAELGALKGRLPKPTFESIRAKLGQGEIDGLMNDLNASPKLDPWEALTAKIGLSKLFAPSGGEVPTLNELSLLKRVFGPGLPDALTRQRPFLQKLGLNFAEAINLPRALMATADLSAPLRQGVFLVGRPHQWLPAFGHMVKQFFSEKTFQASQQQIRARPTYAHMQKAGLSLTDIGASLTQREEVFMSRFAERIPGVGAVSRASNRAYVGFLNKLRADVFDDLWKKGNVLGLTDDPHFTDSLGRFINAATGRGNLPGALERASVALNGLFFAPRLMASRINLLLNPKFYLDLHPSVRKEALASLLTFAGTGLTVLGLAKMNGAQIGTDPRSADFGKIKVGDTRYDIWGGFQQYVRAAGQLISGKYISTTTGREITLGEGYKPLTRKEILQRQVESKSAPVLSFVLGWLEGTSFGEKFKPAAEVVDRFIPMAVQDVSDLIRERGPALGLAMGLPAFLGVGVQTYGDQLPMLERTKQGAEALRFRQQPTLGERAVNAVTGARVSNVPKPFHKELGQMHRQEGILSADIDRAKRLTLQDGQRRQVGNTIIWRDRGVVHSLKTGKSVTSEKRLEELLDRRLQK